MRYLIPQRKTKNSIQSSAVRIKNVCLSQYRKSKLIYKQTDLSMTANIRVPRASYRNSLDASPCIFVRLPITTPIGCRDDAAPSSLPPTKHADGESL